MTQALATTTPAPLALGGGGSGKKLTKAQVDLVKRTIAKGADDDELRLFVATAERLGLDPFARQIHAVKRWDADAGREVMAIQISIDGFRLIADRTGRYAPGRATEYEIDRGQIVSATAYVQKLVNGEWIEVGETAYFEEYVQTKRDGKPIRNWAKMPRVMIAKCAEARAIRRAFPAELSGIYEESEISRDDDSRRPPVEATPPVLEAEIVEEDLVALVKATTTVEECRALAPRLNALPKRTKQRSEAMAAYKAHLAELEQLAAEQAEIDAIAARDGDA